MKPFPVPPLADVTLQLAAVAAGRTPPDAVITGATTLSTYTERLLPNRELWLAAGRIAAVSPAGSCPYPGVPTFDAAGGTIAPGLVDPHVHVESSMMTVCAYAEAALLNGTTTIFCDSHEIGNVCDLAGVEWMLEDARHAALNVFLTVPSTVPATHPGLETAGGDLTAQKVGAIFDRWPEAVALGEKMDFIQVVQGDARSHAILAEALRRGRPVCGHLYGRAFVAAGADPEIAGDFLEAGLWLFLRGGPPTGPWHSLPQAIRAVTEAGAHPKRVCVCTDDRDADDLFTFGLDWVVRAAVDAGLAPVTAWSCGSLPPATRYGFDGEFGGLGHGRRADLVLLDDGLRPQATWLGGRLLVQDRKPTALLETVLGQRYRYPAPAYRTLTLPKCAPLVPPLPEEPVRAHFITLAEAQIPTRHEAVALKPAASWPELLRREDFCHLAVVERYGKGGQVGFGLLKGFGLRDGAVASSVGHDAHNVVVAGTNETDMRVALQFLTQTQGGVCVVRADQVVASVALPVAGLLSDARARVVAEETSRLKEAWTAAGCTLPYMGFNLLPLSVIPEIRLTDRGLVLCPEMVVIPLFETL